MKNFMKEFKEFAMRGNVMDMAVGMIVGAAFNAIITSFVEDVITPLFLTPALKAAGVEQITELSWNGVAYGSFLSAVLNFLIVGTTLFFIVKAANVATSLGKQNQEDAEEDAAPTQEELLTEIRDLLKEK